MPSVGGSALVPARGSDGGPDRCRRQGSHAARVAIVPLLPGFGAGIVAFRFRVALLRATAVGSPKKPLASYSLTRVCLPPLVLCKSLGLGVVCLETASSDLLTGH
jgi:hypothetical protein